MESSSFPSSPIGKRFSRALALACLALAIALPAVTLHALLTTSPEAWWARMNLRPMPLLQPTSWQIALATLIGMLPVCSMAFGLLCARRCFQGFEAGVAFSLGTVKHLRGLAIGMFVAALAGLVAPSLTSVVLTLGAPAGQRAFSLGIGSNDVLVLLFAGIVWQIAHVMTRAAELADDYAQIV